MRKFICLIIGISLFPTLIYSKVLVIDLGQDDEYTEQYYGTLDTDRNNPYPHTKLDSTIIPCRKLNNVNEIFTLT